MRLYLAGPMRGYTDFNFPQFHAAAKELRRAGHDVFNPAERDELMYGCEIFKGDGDIGKLQARGFDLREALAADLKYICTRAEGIALLPQWHHSKGARAEHAVAYALGLGVAVLNSNGEILHYAD